MYSVLIVDDESAVLKGIREKIDWAARGFTDIRTADTYTDALESAILLPPSLMLVDVCLGEEKGYELIERLTALGVKSNYVMMSGYEEFAYAQKALQSGALDYLLKPVEADTLEKAVRRVVREHLGGTEPEQDEVDPILEVPRDGLSPLMQKILRIVCAEYGTSLNLKSLAEKFRMNSAYLGQMFLTETSLKFSEYLMRYRLTRAKELLLNTGEKIAVVASQVGYDDMSHFYRHFKSYFGQSPTDFRGEEKGGT
jgi:YesN/AraC family two-component response regulator